MGCEFQEMLECYGIMSKPTTVKNPTANAVVERIHGSTLGKQLRSTVFESDWSDDVDMLIQVCAYALRAASPARGTYSPAQLVFGYDMVFWQKVLIDWERIKALRVQYAAKNNAKENKKLLEHTYKVGDKVPSCSGLTKGKRREKFCPRLTLGDLSPSQRCSQTALSRYSAALTWML
jgi:hypothetical protein